MKKHILGIAALGLLSACSYEAEPQLEPTPAVPAEQAEASPIIPGQATVLFDDDMIALIEQDLSGGSLQTRSADLNAVLSELGIRSMERVFPDAGEFEPRTRRAGLHKYYSLVFDTDVPVTKAVADLADIPGIQAAEPVRKVYPRRFNDPYFSRQWHYVNNYTSGADVNVDKVWSQYTTGKSDVIVCVVDEPVDPSHPDLQANLWKDASGHTGYNFARNSYDLTIRPQYGNGDVGHGTHVAGTIAAVNNNGIGLCGLAGGDAAAGIPGVRIQSCAIFSGTSYASDAATARAIKWGADHGAVISQNSWGYEADGCLDGNYDGVVSAAELREYKTWKIDSSLRSAIDYFIANAGCDNAGNQLPDSPMKGGLVFFAAGNENIDYDVICDYEPVIAVGAFGRNGSKASYSNYGSWIELGAPGGDGAYSIWSTLPTSIESSGYGGSGWQGTSMACPHASGVAALLVSYFGGAGFTNEQCREFLMEGAVDGYFSASRPLGRKVDAYQSFLYGIAHSGAVVEEPLPPVIDLPMSELTLKAHESRSIKITVSDPNRDAVELKCDLGSPAARISQDGNEYTLTLVGRDAPAGSYQATFTASDPGGLTTTAHLRYTILENHAPVASRFLENIVISGQGNSASVNIAGLFSDPDGEVPSVTVTSSNALVASLNISGEQLYVTATRYGVAEITLTATDALGLQAVVPFSVLVRNEAERMVTAYPNPVKDWLYVRIDSAQADTEVEIFSQTGTSVYHEHVAGASAFFPMGLDLRNLAPGQYSLRVRYEGVEIKKTLVKI